MRKSCFIAAASLVSLCLPMSSFAAAKRQDPFVVPAVVATACAALPKSESKTMRALAVYARSTYQPGDAVFVCMDGPAAKRTKQFIVQTIFAPKGQAMSSGDNVFRCQTADQQEMPICKTDRFVSPATSALLCRKTSKVEDCTLPSLQRPMRARLWWGWQENGVGGSEGKGEVDVITY